MGNFDQAAYTREYTKANYDRVELLIRKGRKDDLKALAKREGLSVSQVIIEAVKSRYGVDLSK